MVRAAYMRLGAPGLPRQFSERHFQVMLCMTANPVEMHQEAGSINAFRALQLDAGRETDIIQDRSDGHEMLGVRKCR